LNKDSPYLCVSCNNNYIQSSNGEFVIKSDNNQKLDAKVDIQQYLEETNQIKAQLGPLIDLSNAPILKHALQEDDPSNLISKKMLQGYTLIDSICGNPSCSGNIPLLRDKNGKLFCVLCDDNKSNSKQIEEKMNIDIGRTSSDDSSNSFDDADDEIAYSEYMKRRLAGGNLHYIIN